MVLGHNAIPHHHHQFCIIDQHSTEDGDCQDHSSQDHQNCTDCDGLDPWDKDNGQNECGMEDDFFQSRQIASAVLFEGPFLADSSPGSKMLVSYLSVVWFTADSKLVYSLRAPPQA